ncbi:hypothetical protein ACF1A4_30425 [Streptomyces albidoflavus]
MPDDRYKTPRPESIAAVKSMLVGHSAVLDFKEIEPRLYEISRRGRTDVNLYITNLYTVGVADVQEILDDHPSVTCILTVSVWNSYTRQAKEYAKSNKVGLFLFYELKGALNFDGSQLLDYIAPKDRE